MVLLNCCTHRFCEKIQLNVLITSEGYPFFQIILSCKGVGIVYRFYEQKNDCHPISKLLQMKTDELLWLNIIICYLLAH